MNAQHNTLSLTGKHKRLPRRQLFTATIPGPIVHDFAALLDYVYAHPLPVTGTQQLPLRTLPEINARLYRPIQLGLQRPQQKSYPAIRGLYPGRHTLGLLELFGCIEIQPGAPIAGHGWQITHLDRTPFGDALLALLAATFFAVDDRRSDLYEVTPLPPGTLQPALRPYIPQWERLLPLPVEATVRDGVHIFKVALGKNLWRRLALPATSTLDELARLILHAYTFDSDHLYRFSYQNRYGRLCHINHTYLEEAPWTSAVRVGELPLALGQTMTFLFDLNDRWEFEVTLEAVDTDSTAAQAPRVLERRGKAPQQYA